MFNKNSNRKVLADKIYQNIGFSKIISENIVNDIFQIIILALISIPPSAVFGSYY